MKEESVLFVLMYLFKHHMHDGLDLGDIHSKLAGRLENEGFDRQAVHQAFDWLGNLEEQMLCDAASKVTTGAIRLYAGDECKLLSKECRGYLFTLEQYGILKSHTRELVIHQALALQDEGIDVHLIKWVTLLVLFTQPDEQDELACMEFLVLDDQMGSVH